MAPPKGATPSTHVSKAMLAEKERAQEVIRLRVQKLEAIKSFDAKMLARAYTKEAVETLVEIMQNPKASNTDRATCAKIILDRGHGRAPVMLENDEGVKIPVVFLPVELNEDRQAITVQVAKQPQLPKYTEAPRKAWHEETDEDPSNG